MTLATKLQRIDLLSLRLFVSVAKEGSITRTAEHAHIAISALSRRLTELENVVGASLLERSRKGVNLTAVGQVVFQYAERIQDELSCLLADACNVQTASNTLRLHASHSSATVLLPDLLRTFQPEQKNTRIEVSESSSREVISACANGTAEVGLGLGEPTSIPTTLEHWNLWTDRLQVVLPSDHVLAKQPGGLRLEQVLAFPLIVANASGGLLDTLRRQAWESGITLSPQILASNFEAACQLTAGKLGIAVMPGISLGINLPATLTKVPLLEPWALRCVVLYSHAQRERSLACKALIQHFRMRARVMTLLRHKPQALAPSTGLET